MNNLEIDLYLMNITEINANAVGYKKYFVMIYRELVDALDEEELLFVIGHELSHIKFEHMLYLNLTVFISNILLNVLPYIPVVRQIFEAGFNIIIKALFYSLLYWSRMAEYSADRGGLIVCQNLTKSQSALAKLLGFSYRYESEINTDEVLNQDKSVENLDLLPTIHKYFLLLHSSHLFIPNRIKKLNEWSKTTEYQNLLNGIYPTLEPNYQNTYYNYPNYPNYPYYPNYSYYPVNPYYPNYPNYTNYQNYPNYPNYPNYQNYQNNIK
jgi:Zn-dependent protease with chaperone function